MMQKLEPKTSGRKLTKIGQGQYVTHPLFPFSISANSGQVMTSQVDSTPLQEPSARQVLVLVPDNSYPTWNYQNKANCRVEWKDIRNILQDTN